MTEALIGDLAKLRSLTVISRTSVMRYKGSDLSLPQIARELNVDGILEGTVMRAGDRVRITAQLIDARSDSHLWNDRYDRDLSDVLALHSDVARSVAEQVRLKLNADESAALTARRSVDPRAYDAYLRGLKLRGPPTLVVAWAPAAMEQFEQAVELDRSFAEAYAAMADVRFWLGLQGLMLVYRTEFHKAREAVRRALELDDRLGAAHATLGRVRLYYDWDFPGARRSFERAVRLTPSDPSALLGYAQGLWFVESRFEEAYDAWQKVAEVAPLDSFYAGERFEYLFYTRRYDRAIKEVESIRKLDPAWIVLDVPMTYFLLDRLEEAHHHYIAFYERCGAPCDQMREAQERGWAEGGWEGAMHGLLGVLTRIEGFSPVAIASIHALVGETEESFDWLERGYRERDPQMIYLKAYPLFDPLRSDPRFIALLRRMGLEE
jgi:tetratricopeptide (TPR) repeat protein